MVNINRSKFRMESSIYKLWINNIPQNMTNRSPILLDLVIVIEQRTYCVTFDLYRIKVLHDKNKMYGMEVIYDQYSMCISIATGVYVLI